MWDKFKSILEDFQTQCIPDKCIRKTKTRKPLWWNQEIGRKVQEKKRDFKNYKGSNWMEDLNHYRQMCDEVNNQI